MIRADFLLFLGVATAAHLAIVPALDPSGRTGGGTAGQDRVTLAASAPTALVEHWETRPAPAENAPAMRAPTTGETPTRPASEAQARPAARPDRPVTTAAAPPPRVPQHVPAPARTNTAAPALPVPDMSRQHEIPPDTEIPAHLTGHALMQDGFTKPFDRPIMLNVQCFGPWCAGATSGIAYLGFLEQRDEG